MIYLLILGIFCVGVGFHVMQSIRKLRDQFPKLGFKEVFTTFFKQEWDSLMVSGLVLCVLQLAMYIIDMTNKHLPLWVTDWGMYAAPLVFGYAGQRISYKWLGTASDVLERKADELNGKP